MTVLVLIKKSFLHVFSLNKQNSFLILAGQCGGFSSVSPHPLLSLCKHDTHGMAIKPCATQLVTISFLWLKIALTSLQNSFEMQS